MNAARFIAISLNPNLTDDQRAQLIGDDTARAERLLGVIGDNAKQLAHDCGRETAIRYISECVALLLVF